MSLAVCPQCSQAFDRDEPWKRICLDCWIENKRREEGGARKQQRRPSGGSGSRRQDHAPPLQPTLDKDMLRRLLQLCHPDKHSNSQAATEVTSWLLKQRH